MPFLRSKLLVASKKTRAAFVRNVAFGIEDGLVSTVGLLAGVATANVSRRDIIVTGIVLIVVEGFSMGVGSFLSESESETYEHGEKAKISLPIVDSLLMFFSYFVTGFLVLLPYVLLEVTYATPASIAVALVALLLLGLAVAKISHVKPWRTTIRLVVIGGIAVGLGVLVGRLLM